ncbi:MAG: translation elongation factor Ts [Candidatus Uhrbacteria bacterium]|nr:translation elongation factor Ts [Candidatus Uhrbacteria bacterium]
MIDAKLVGDLRARTGAGIVDCKKALVEADGDIEKAIEILRKTGAIKAAKKNAERQTTEGLIEAYVHSNGKVGAMIELQCETDFVARNADFHELAHDIAMQIVAMSPLYVSPDQVPAELVEKEMSIYMGEESLANKPEEIKKKIVDGKLNKWYEEICLLNQLWMKDDSMTIGQLIERKIATIGEKIVIARFTRFELAAGPEVCE